ncbi:hypothetical protein A0H81_02327 [Grifola frondosa]|uniref:Uncharacterized protein n=1 Tax=Grifola frondosa TaxID=5627 RepID=A0A1C7MNR5_GRIFR|nr:hypothetical protein A0H81_02327 [Grifola frondosa]
MLLSSSISQFTQGHVVRILRPSPSELLATGATSVHMRARRLRAARVLFAMNFGVGMRGDGMTFPKSSPPHIPFPRSPPSNISNIGSYTSSSGVMGPSLTSLDEVLMIEPQLDSS